MEGLEILSSGIDGREILGDSRARFRYICQVWDKPIIKCAKSPDMKTFCAAAKKALSGYQLSDNEVVPKNKKDTKKKKSTTKKEKEKDSGRVSITELRKLGAPQFLTFTWAAEQINAQ